MIPSVCLTSFNIYEDIAREEGNKFGKVEEAKKQRACSVYKRIKLDSTPR